MVLTFRSILPKQYFDVWQPAVPFYVCYMPNETGSCCNLETFLSMDFKAKREGSKSHSFIEKITMHYNTFSENYSNGPGVNINLHFLNLTKIDPKRYVCTPFHPRQLPSFIINIPIKALIKFFFNCAFKYSANH